MDSAPGYRKVFDDVTGNVLDFMSCSMIGACGLLLQTPKSVPSLL
jgi:hypothetical protein